MHERCEQLGMAGPRAAWWTRALPPAMAVATLLGSATPAGAQDGRVFIHVNGGAQATSTDFSDNVVFTEFVEEGDFDATYAIDNGVIFDVGGGFVLGRDFALAVAYTRFNRDDDGSVDARIPHPFFFNRDRAIAGSAANLGRTEHGMHLQVRWFAPVPGPFEVVVFGGPTFFNVRQDLVTSVGFSHSFPFNEASFTTASIARRSDSAVGYNVGADVSYFFSPHIGVGGLARFTRGSVDLASEDSGLVSTDAGGFHTGGGLRLRF
ncbi:MAG: hypothetical protein QGG89_09605 [Vicinamibacterales bacterium]|nr:hypothetical protein [Vicinamibacterales bacterium]